jgi:hypothetical protein
MAHLGVVLDGNLGSYKGVECVNEEIIIPAQENSLP